MEIIKNIKYTNEDVISNLKSRFGDLYDYDNVNYISSFIRYRVNPAL